MAKARSSHRGFLRYKSYSFVSKDPIIDAFRTLREDPGLSFTEINGDGGPPPGTMRSWEYGNVRRPQFATIWAAARACGAVGIVSGDNSGHPRFVTNGHLHPKKPVKK